ncbi:ATP-binding cassette domain-containing protein [Staphylococcus chromogenes]|uniref:ATP-binding cassette domain-containing protein n=1 Tax=Staphylococcus chromogenes TaxID=46126 RepID=UPI001644DA22|nr:ATP-binding cassette domain-containing protein [Staphylococcus chromogenes]
MTNKSLLKVENLYFSYDKVTIFDDLSFTVCPGEIIGLLGKNGSGKTTLLKLLSGELEKNNKSIQRYESNLFIPTNLYMYPFLTVREFISYISNILKKDTHSISKYVEQMSLSSYYDSLINSLSFGTKNKLSLLCGLLESPPLLLLDEPLTGFDPITTSVTENILLEVVKQNKIKSIIISSHRLDIINNICNRIIILKDNNIVLDKYTKDLNNLDTETINSYLKGD